MNKKFPTAEEKRQSQVNLDFHLGQIQDLIEKEKNLKCVDYYLKSTLDSKVIDFLKEHGYTVTYYAAPYRDDDNMNYYNISWQTQENIFNPVKSISERYIRENPPIEDDFDQLQGYCGALNLIYLHFIQHVDARNKLKEILIENNFNVGHITNLSISTSGGYMIYIITFIDDTSIKISDSGHII